MNKKIVLYSEPMYIFAMALMAFAVATVASAGFGVSMIVAPAYILSLRIDFLSFGQCEYIFQGFLFLVFCLIMRKIKIWYLDAFLTCLIYGCFLDFFRKVIPVFNPEITNPESLSLAFRIFLFSGGMILTAFALAVFFRVYFCPQVYDFFVRELTKKFNVSKIKFKTIFDMSFLLTAVILSLVFFHKFNGIGLGTVVMTLVNGTIIGLACKIVDSLFEFKAIFPKLEKVFTE